MLVFIDESGHPRPTDSTTRPVIQAVCIMESDVGPLTRWMFAIRKNLLGKIRLTKAEQEGKAVDFLNRRSITKSVAKREFAETVFDRLRDFDLTTFAIVMERPTQMPYEGPAFLQTQHRWLLERIERFMDREHPRFHAVPVFDGQDPNSNKKFADCFTAFMARTTAGKAMHHIVPSPLFVDSSLTPGIQIADLFAYVTRLNYEHGLYQTGSLADPYFSTIKRYANVVRQKTINYERDDGTYWYGIATMDSTKFIYGPPGPGSALVVDEEEVGVAMEDEVGVAMEDEIVSPPAPHP
jgi:hypothetical protein